MGMKFSKKTLIWGAVAVSALGTQAPAADWFAKDNLQPGHDPTVYRDENGYILMSTNNNLSMWTSPDMVKWTAKGRIFNDSPQWLKDAVGGKTDGIWAPDLFHFNNQYGVFYCGSVFGKRTSAIGVTTNANLDFSNPAQGWTDQGEVTRTTNSNNYNAIDADVVVTPDGQYWMTYGSWNAGGIRLIKLDPKTGKQASDDKTNYQIATRGGSGIEGPSLIEHGGQYFLFTAWDVCCKQGDEIEQTTYKTAMGRADKVNGTYKDRGGKELNSGGGTILMQRYSRYVGPGGGEAFKDLNRIRFVHHYYDLNGDKFNHIHIRDLVFTDDNWPEMGQPFLGRYLSAEAEHGIMTRAVSGDITFNYTKDASNGEYVGYINTKGSKIRLPMNIMQAGDYLLRYRYANGGDAEATHKVTVNGKTQTVKLPVTGAWGTFPEKSVVYIPVTLKRGGNFIEVEPDQNFAELDRIDFLRIIRDTIPTNGFDNGIKVRLTDKDEFAIKEGGYAIFENAVLDSLKDVSEVFLQVKSASSGKIQLREGSKDGTAFMTCDLSNASPADNGWSMAKCTGDMSFKGTKDLYLTASGVSGETILGNLVFQSRVVCSQEPCGDPASSSSTEPSSAESSSGTTGLDGIAGVAGKPHLLGFSREAGVRFSAPVKYVLADMQGNILRVGYGEHIAAESLNAGVYVLRYAGKAQAIKLK